MTSHPDRTTKRTRLSLRLSRKQYIVCKTLPLPVWFQPLSWMYCGCIILYSSLRNRITILYAISYCAMRGQNFRIFIIFLIAGWYHYGINRRSPESRSIPAVINKLNRITLHSCIARPGIRWVKPLPQTLLPASSLPPELTANPAGFDLQYPIHICQPSFQCSAAFPANHCSINSNGYAS